MTLTKCIQWLILKHGTLRGVARVTGVDVGYLSRLMSGEKTEPSEETLKALGIRRIVEYRLEKTELEKTLHKAMQK